MENELIWLLSTSLSKIESLILADTIRCVRNLPMNIRDVNWVVIDEAKSADSSCTEIERAGTTEATAADDKSTALFELALRLDTELFDYELSGIALDFLITQSTLRRHSLSEWCSTKLLLFLWWIYTFSQLLAFVFSIYSLSMHKFLSFSREISYYFNCEFKI